MMFHCTGLIRLFTVLQYISCSLVISESVRMLSGRQEIRYTHLTNTAFSAFTIMAIPWPAKALFRTTGFTVSAAFLITR